MILRDIDSLTKADIENLISNQVTESKQLEYKRDLPDRIDSAKKEFLADVSSFANASGGDIIFGLEAELDDGSSVCLLYTSPSPRDRQKSRMPSSA